MMTMVTVFGEPSPVMQHLDMLQQPITKRLRVESLGPMGRPLLLIPTKTFHSAVAGMNGYLYS